MKAYFLFTLLLLSFFSCVSSQNSSSAEAKMNIDKIRSLINASADQAKQLTKSQAIFLEKSKALNANDKHYTENLSQLKGKRNNSFKKILNREQYIKWIAIDKNSATTIPPRFNSTTE